MAEDQTNELGDFFSKMNQEELKTAQETFDHAPEDQQSGNVEVPGKYLMRVRNFCGKKKDDGTPRFVSPKTFVSSKKKVLMLSLVLEVVDGTPAVPAGSILFHNTTLLPGSGASGERIEQTMRFMKPVIKALTGLSEIQINEDFFHEYLEIECEFDPFKIVKDHKMKKNVLVTVEEEYNETKRKNECRVKLIAPAKEGDKSLSKITEPQENASLDQEASNTKGSNIDLSVDENAIMEESSDGDTPLSESQLQEDY